MSGAMLFGGIFLGLAVLINFIFVVRKFKAGRHIDAITDISIIFIASAIYGASLMGGVIATIGSMFISIYLHYVPLNLFPDTPDGKFSTSDSERKWTEHIDALFD